MQNETTISGTHLQSLANACFLIIIDIKFFHLFEVNRGS